MQIANDQMSHDSQINEILNLYLAGHLINYLRFVNDTFSGSDSEWRDGVKGKEK